MRKIISYEQFVLYYLVKNNVKLEKIIKFSFDFDEDLDKLDKYYPEENAKIYEKNKKLRQISLISRY